MSKLLFRLRLRHKLAALLSIAALLPVGVVSWLAVSVVLGNLDRGLSDETERQLQVGLSLVLRHVESIGADAIRLSRGGELSAAMIEPELELELELAPEMPHEAPSGPSQPQRAPAGQPGSQPPGARATDLAGESAAPAVPASPARRLSGALDRVSAYLSPSLVQVFDREGLSMAETAVGTIADRLDELRVPPRSAPVVAALEYQSPLTIEPVGRILVVRAAAPIVDPSYRLLGAVVVSSPLDGQFADELKSALGTDVLIFAAERAIRHPDDQSESDGAVAVHHAISTFLDNNGQRETGIFLAPRTAFRAHEHESVLQSRSFFGHEYEIGYTGLVDLDRRRVGVFAVAVDRAPLVRAKSAATRSLYLGAGGAFVFALALAGFLTRQLTRPIARLHRGALAVARGDLDQRIELSERDEIGDLATAFSFMTETLKENQERLAARMREIVALHDAGRAVSSVIDLSEVLHTIVDSVAQVLDGTLCALWLVESPGANGRPPDLFIGAARVKELNDPSSGEFEARADRSGPLRLSRKTTSYDAETALPLASIAADVASQRSTLRIDCAADDPGYREQAVSVGITGSLLATPLERKSSVVGVLVVGRQREGELFSEADSNLLATFADQAATAIENARLYEEVRAFNEELEAMVRARTAELTRTNDELGRTITELRETQAQLILSERMAGLGLLVASVAHEINSPTAAIAGSVDTLANNVAQLRSHTRGLFSLPVDPGERAELIDRVTERAPRLAELPMKSAVTVRRSAKALRKPLQEAGISSQSATIAARRLAEIIPAPVDGQTDALASSIARLASSLPDDTRDQGAELLAGYLSGSVFLLRTAHTIQRSIERIQTIVRALKTYSHLDQEAGLVPSDLHEGIENTLVILHYELRDITIAKKYGELPAVPTFVDELNQVWTNLIHNAVQALQGQGEIAIETRLERGGALVRIVDNGPGIPAEVVPRIFEPFFTTKPKGEGTGLGLGIVRQIIDKHRGEVTCNSRPGMTCFEVWLPIERDIADDEPGDDELGKVAP